MTISILEAPPTYRYEDTVELLKEKGLWARLKLVITLRDNLRKALRDTWPFVEKLEKILTEVKDVSLLEEIRSTLITILEAEDFILKECECSTIVRRILKPLIDELSQLHERVDDLLENVELALDPTFRRSIEKALSELPQDVGSKAKEELNDWLHH